MNNNQLKLPHRLKTLNPSIIQNPRNHKNPNPKQHAKPQLRSSSDHSPDFAALPNDILTIISSHLSLDDVKHACLVCKSWRNGLWPLWEEMMFLGQWGRRCNKDEDNESFLYRAVRVSMLALVDAGLVYWDMDKKENEGAVGGDHLDAEPQNMKEAVKWLYQASEAGYVRQQYQLAFCLHRVIGTDQNMKEAVRWYVRAAEVGHIHAMYEVAMCYASGRGITQDRKQSRKWMKLSANHGHKKAQFEHGRTLYSKGARLAGAVYLELAERGGVKAATNVKNAML